ncbi:98ceeef0-2ac6-4293-be16-fee04c23634d [Thermothielavioides terrestris]|uniref:98ceeef0-2ac6-4293-be16-fee04c23634d n=1 Tax=Thermothielavioides terrestris TaxID=2587410 RepID=A0A446B6N7_9PEZI|nr:98ceeef0-2ac6-4293-be16-fee04c23634d [Thermothielavioides terrestris]
MATRGAPPPGLPAKVASVPPNQTLYVTNLPSAKIQKEDLRTALYMLFSTYGSVLDVVALKTMKMRGQAHIVYKDIQTATQAMRSLDGFEFLGRPMKISYAKSKSNIIAKLDGTFKIPAASSAARVEVTDLQQSIFNAPVPGSSTTGAPPAATGLPSKPPGGADHAAADAGTPESRGVKRPREEEEPEEESDQDVAMEEESDEE